VLREEKATNNKDEPNAIRAGEATLCHDSKCTKPKHSRRRQPGRRSYWDRGEYVRDGVDSGHWLVEVEINGRLAIAFVKRFELLKPDFILGFPPVLPFGVGAHQFTVDIGILHDNRSVP
jgi:hypothetical protein